MLKICYTTIVNENYLPYLDELLVSYEKFSNIDLIVYTINFEINDISRNGVTFKKITDNNLLEYEKNGFNKYIKNDYEKHKYTTFLKPKILKMSPEEYDYFFFIDVDCIFTKNSDNLFLNTIKQYGDTTYPLSVKYFYDYSDTHNTSEIVILKDGTFNIKSANYYELIKLYNTEYNKIFYMTTYCLFYTKKCYSFFQEVENICYDEKVSEDYKKFLPMGDETAFNYLYSKYNLKNCISSNLCYNIHPHKKIDNILKELKKLKEVICFIHTKRLHTNTFYGEGLKINTDEYKKIINVLSNHEIDESKIKIKNINSGKIEFCVNNEYENSFRVKIVSHTIPNLESRFSMFLKNNFCYWLQIDNKKIIKDLFMVIDDDDLNIKDVVKLS